MAAIIRKFASAKERLKETQAQELRQALLPFMGSDDYAMSRTVGAMVATLDQHTAAKNGWSFVMLSPAQNAAVVQWLAEHSSRPKEALILWAQCFTALRSDSGEIMLTRDELADRLKIGRQNVSTIMSDLEKIGAIIRRRDRVAGMRGPGPVRYFMNPTVATHLAGKARQDAQAAAPALLKLMETE